ncbi:MULTISPECIES: hypothetical protein [unclassified Haloferax]|jgi:hypothetical protein|uniref:hypothetical protein n=1 Tax=unclassified Haloferax TaxID=2625095 RepID=UPI00287636D8|nr:MULTISPECIES: hypothetical protein [unclassified Haloferax]MDS0243169.1 hypothetical protein [Haloferax sp. S2CR25]MDS0446290.1 hypothetical protein [Haloferax sp. S2CR25-2]
MDGNRCETVDTQGTTVDDLVAIGRLLDSPRLAYIWFTLYVEGGIASEESDSDFISWEGLTVSDLSEYLDGEVPQSTPYNDMSEMEEVGALRVESDGQPTGYSSKFFQTDAENVEKIGGGGLVGPQIVGLVGEAFTDKAVLKFIDAYSYGLLNDVLQMYTASLRGQLNHSFYEVLPDVDSDDLKSIVPAIERVLLGMSRAPLWGEDFRPDLSTIDTRVE